MRSGRQAKDAMTAARAAAIRGTKFRGAKTNAQLRAEKNADKARMTITRLWDAYSMYRVRRKSLAPDRRRFEQHIRPAFGDRIPEEIDPLSPDRFRAKLAKTVSSKTKKPLSPTTVHHVMALLRQIVNFGVLRNLTKGFSGKVPVPPMPANMKTEDLTEPQLAALLKALDEETDQDAADIMRVALFTGARRGEILKVQWDDIDLARGVRTLRDRKDGRDTGFPLSTAAKLPKGFRVVHGLRHHYASLLVSKGVDLYVVSKLLGHSDPTLTAKRYAHLRPGVMAEAAELAGHLVTAVGKKT